MSIQAEQIYRLSRDEKLAVFEILCDSLMPEVGADVWPMDELDRRWMLHEKGENNSLPLAEAMNEARRMLSENQA